MVEVVCVMLAAVFLVLLWVMMSLVKRGGRPNAKWYEIFKISDHQLVVMTGIPVTYEINEIEEIVFSVRKTPRSLSSYHGVMRIIKKNGKKSRRFLFDSSAYTKRMVLVSSKQDIEQTIQYLMNEIRPYQIRCSCIM